MSIPAYDPKSYSIFETRHHLATACVGDNGLNDFETYATGYFEAARLLLAQATDPRKCLTLDTIVYPILFNLRHGVELSIKHVSRVLSEAKLPNPGATQNTHELEQLWADLTEQSKPDRRLIAAIEELEPAVLQMHEADPLAQEFRYAERNDGVPSFKGRHIVDLVTVLELADFTAERFEQLFYRSRRIASERRYGSFTPELNRDELEQLSKDLPDAHTWSDSTKFKEVKADWTKRYRLSGNAFCRAIDFIKKHREFSANIGLRKPLVGLNGETLERLLSASIQMLSEHWKEGQTLRAVFDRKDPVSTAINSTGIKLTKTLVAEVRALFYQGRDGDFSEEYETRFKSHDGYRADVSQQVLLSDFRHVFSKLNFAECLCEGLRQIGYPEFAAKFRPQVDAIKSGVPSIREANL
ncbi:MAG: hypothetical protein QM790_17490 [Nibricoccus sp.]